ncbi:hypothetical protein MASR1M8_19920 [Thermomonas brevis]
MARSCPRCACTQPHPAHALLAALRDDDLDAALDAGLLDAPPCPGCDAACNRALASARDARGFALAARERHRARDARLQRRKAEREAARRAAPRSDASTTANDLPPAAADALARALAKARERRR